ncbi:ATP-NAD kinase family protein [Arthrobacter sp. A2-55]|uniref:ATP-NAD kinase family protein n=1 Tax=Arthrobacter sp. A2-55 TaxID=2897337 RepID=UPI0021CD75C3|nr:NAD(+)/NADH kinase [Arthrobacter sp. A2-55]MCU6481343.1 NAD(+)/NADH kinase [Arthrobacter sp. A2-55]
MDIVSVGLIVNPIAGLGGPSGQKGSDAADIREIARRSGYSCTSPIRARRAVAQLSAQLERTGRRLRLFTGPGALGEDAARGLCTTTVLAGDAAGSPTTDVPANYGSTPDGDTPANGTSSAGDTRRLARLMAEAGVDLILFAGGDGTARDVLDAVGGSVPVLGIPAGVKIYSAVFALTPTAAGSLAAAWLAEGSRDVADRDVVDIDEELLRAGLASPALYGTLSVPVDPSRLQARKAATPASDANAVAALARAFVRGMDPRSTYILGPGGTTQAIGAELGLATTRLGVDVVRRDGLLAADADSHTLEAMLDAGFDGSPAVVVLTPLGGQGFVVGRGNQQVTARMLSRLPLQIVATDGKLASLAGRPLWVDSGNDDVDARLSGYAKVFTGAGTHTVYPVRRVLEETSGNTTTKEY